MFCPLVYPVVETIAVFAKNCSGLENKSVNISVRVVRITQDHNTRTSHANTDQRTKAANL